ncbi:hypothetical protein D3C79_777090 [compost metagenome]
MLFLVLEVNSVSFKDTDVSVRMCRLRFFVGPILYVCRFYLCVLLLAGAAIQYVV